MISERCLQEIQQALKRVGYKPGQLQQVRSKEELKRCAKRTIKLAEFLKVEPVYLLGISADDMQIIKEIIALQQAAERKPWRILAEE